MSDAATFQTRLVPPGTLAPLLVRASTTGVAVAVGGAWLGLTPLVVGLLIVLAILGIALRGVARAEYVTEAAGLTERLAPVLGGRPQSRSWAWQEMHSYTLDREPTRAMGLRNVLLIRLPRYTIRLREPDDASARDAYARFVDRFVGFATGDAPQARKPLPSSEVPQLRRTLANQPAFRPAVPLKPPFLTTPAGRAVAAVGATAILALAGVAVIVGAPFGSWYSLVFILLPGAIWLGWRAIGGGQPE